MGISISIKAGADESSSSVIATGNVQHIITDDEVKSFGLKDSDLKNAIGKYFGKNPNDAYLHSPTPWGDLYKTYNWPQVQTHMVVQSAKILGITSEPVIVATKTFTNKSSKPVTFDASISDQVQNTVESSWSITNTVSIDQKFTYDVSFLGTGGGGETDLGFSLSLGESTTESKSVTVGTSSGVTVPVDPGESIEVELSASRGVMNVQIVFEAYLDGDTAINYDPTYKGHHFWGLPIGSVMGAAQISNDQTFTQNLQIGYYSNSNIVVKDGSGQVKATTLAKAGV